MNFLATRVHCLRSSGGEAISLNILMSVPWHARSARGPTDPSSPSPTPSQMLSSQSEISASPEIAPLPQIAFHICVRMSTMCMFNMWPLITLRQSIKAIRATGAEPGPCAGKIIHGHIRGHFLLLVPRNESMISQNGSGGLWGCCLINWPQVGEDRDFQ